MNVLERARAGFEARAAAWLMKRFAAMPAIVQQYGGQDVAPDENFDDYGQVYGRHPWVYSAIYRLMTAGTSVPWALYRRDPKTGEREKVTDHWIANLIRRPNPRRSWSDIIEATIGFMELSGNGYLAFDREESITPNEIWVLHPARVTLIPDPDIEVGGFIYTVQGNKVLFGPEDVAHVKYWNPSHDLHGQGSLTAARSPLINDLAASQYNNRFFKNGARPGGLLSTKEELSDPEIKRMREAWNKQNLGPEQWHGVNVMWGDVKYTDVGVAPKDADFIDGRKLNREEILATHNVPPAEVGVFEYANYANVKEQRRILWEGMIPRLNKIRDSINIQFVWRFDPNLEIDYDTSNIDVLQEDKTARTERQIKGIQWGTLSPNEARAQNGLDPRPGGDVWGSPMGWVPTGGDVPEPDDPPADDPDKGVAPGFLDRKSDPPSYHDVNRVLRELDAEEAWKLYKATKGVRGGSAAAGADGVMDLVSVVNPDASYVFMADPVAMERLAAEGLTKSRIITGTLRGRIAGALEASIQEGASVTELIGVVNDYTADMVKRKGWAMTVARTESRGSMNFGAKSAMVDVGIQKKIWGSSRSATTRETHLADDDYSHDNPVPMNDPFPNTGLDAPGIGGDAAEVCNCACDLIPAIEGLEGKALRKYTKAWSKAAGIKNEALSRPWIRPLNKYLKEYAGRVASALRDA